MTRFRSSTTTTDHPKPPQQQKQHHNNNDVVTLVATKLAERKRDDINYLRHYLLHPEEEPQHRTRSSRRDATKSSDSVESTKNSTMTTTTPSQRIGSSTRRRLRCLWVDLPLLVLFAAGAAVFSARTLWEKYYVPLINRARRTDAQLLEEYTYYERYCTADDITDLVTPPKERTMDQTVSPTEAALDVIMEHGAVTIPQLLSPTTVQALQTYLQYKNAHIHEEEVYEVSQGYQRLSYGLEPTEDPAVQQALAEITSHPLLPSLLEAILGVPDPALTELTAITAYYRAEDQVLHSDTKADGYAAQFGRTYTHTYSLFVPVQDTTADMGVTLVCPGTHYCTNDDMAEYCRDHSSLVGVDQVFAEVDSVITTNTSSHDTTTPSPSIWKAGDGFLFNQQVWHGGSAHTNADRTERIMFVVSFAARPQLGRDPRQLARGTYFHMKWNMWGHTWSDIAHDDSMSTAWPFNVFRSLAIWKPRGKYWGYDLLLSAALRAANEQSGMEVYDLETFVKLKMNGMLRYPPWLQGTVSRDSETPWQDYIQETLDQTFSFLQWVNGIVLGSYTTLALIFTVRARRSIASTDSGMGLKSVVGRLVGTHGLVALVTWGFLRRVERSDWGSNLLSGKTFQRPFPTNAEFTSQRWERDPMVPQGETTLPERMDVLFGTRLDAEFLGSYNRWFDYHPGNRVFSEAIASRAPYYSMVQDDHGLLNALVNDVVNEVGEKIKPGRFLGQDHLSGDWVVLADGDSIENIRLALSTESFPLSKPLYQSLKFLLAKARFDDNRGTALAFESTAFLHSLQGKMFGRPLTASISPRPTRQRSSYRSLFFPASRALQSIPTAGDGALVKSASRITRSRFRGGDKQQLRAGTAVMVYWSASDEWVKGTVDSIVSEGDSYDVLYDDGEFEEEVSIRRIRRPTHLQEGTRVTGYLEDGGAYDGKVTMVYPGGNIDIEFDDGDVATDFLPGEYDLIYPPFDV